MFKKEFLKSVAPFYTDDVLDALYPDDPHSLGVVLTDRRIPREHRIRIGAYFLGNNLIPLLREFDIEGDSVDALIGYALRVSYQKASEETRWEEDSVITQNTLDEIYDKILFKMRVVLCLTEITRRFNSMMIL